MSVSNLADARASRPIPFIPFANIAPSLDDDEHLVEGILPLNGVGFLWSPPKTGKTGAALDLALHVATCREWHGRAVAGGPVVYLAAEGQRGIAKRISAWSQAHLERDDSAVPFCLVPARLNLIKQAPELIALIRANLGSDSPKLVIVDTLNKTLVGSESDDRDMNAYLTAISSLREAFDCFVLVLHHCGHDSSRMRGHSSIQGDLDVELALKREEGGFITMTVAASRDEEAGAVLAWKSESILIGRTKRGTAVTSFVLRPVESSSGERPSTSSSKAARETRLNKSDTTALRALHEAIVELGADPPAGERVPANTRVVTKDQWREFAYRMGISDTNNGDARRMAFGRAYKSLLSSRHVAVWDEHVWLPPKQPNERTNTNTP